MSTKEQLIEWLGDAYAMEKEIAARLRQHSMDAEDYPDIKATIDLHLMTTERHAADVLGCLHLLDEDASLLKTTVAQAKGILGGLTLIVIKDALIKNAIDEIATEHYEIAFYTSLIAVAKELGELTIASVCDRILIEEQTRAVLLQEKLPEITTRYLSQLDLELAHS